MVRLLFTFSLIIITYYNPSIVHGASIPQSKNNDEMRSPLNFFTNDTTPNNSSPLKILLYENKTLNMINNGKIVRVYTSTPNNRSYITGGPMGDNKYYYFNGTKWYWNPDGIQPCCNRIDQYRGTAIIASFIFFNSIYQTLTEAYQKLNGIIVLNWPIRVDGRTDNTRMSNFKKAIKEINGAGNQTVLDRYDCLRWFTYMSDCIENYYYYDGQYYDEETGTSYSNAKIIDLSPGSSAKISWKDFRDTFLQIEGYNNSAPQSQFPGYPQGHQHVNESSYLNLTYSFS